MPKPIKIDPSRKWCVYKTTHPAGFYYIGKGVTARVENGSYKGSGTKLKAAYIAGYPSIEWTSVVLETFPSIIDPKTDKDIGERIAYNREKEIVTFETLCDPFCMNSMAGGVGGWKWKRLSAEKVKSRSKAISIAMTGKKRGPQSKSTIEKRRETLLKPEIASKLGHSKGKKLSPENCLKISVGIANSEKKQCPKCGAIVTSIVFTKHHGDNCKVEEKRIARIEARLAYEVVKDKIKEDGYKKVSEKVKGHLNGAATAVIVDGQKFDCGKYAIEHYSAKHGDIRHWYQIVRDHVVIKDGKRLLYINRKIVSQQDDHRTSAD